jgi:Trehalose receptor
MKISIKVFVVQLNQVRIWRQNFFRKAFFKTLNFSVILISQFFGMFPYTNITSKNLKSMRFKWKSFRTAYSSIFVLNTALNLIASIHKRFTSNIVTPSNLNGTIFYATSMLSLVFFLSTDWRHFFAKWSEVEGIFFSEKYKHLPQKATLKQKLYILIGFGFSAFVLNQILYIYTEVRHVGEHNSACNFTEHHIVESFITHHMEHIFNILPYSHILGFTVEILNMACGFFWTIPDLFVTVISLAVSHLMQQINQRIEFFRSRILPDSIWLEVRINYAQVCELVKFVDETFGKIILLAALNNSYLILVQLLYNLT